MDESQNNNIFDLSSINLLNGMHPLLMSLVTPVFDESKCLKGLFADECHCRGRITHVV